MEPNRTQASQMNEKTDVEYLKTEFEKFRRLEITVNELCERDFIAL